MVAVVNNAYLGRDQPLGEESAREGRGRADSDDGNNDEMTGTTMTMTGTTMTGRAMAGTMTDVIDAGIAISEFPDVATRIGVTEFLTAFSPHLVSNDRWRSTAGLISGPLRRAVDLLLLHETVPLAELPGELAEAFPGLVQAGLGTLEDGKASLGGLALHVSHGVFLFAERRHVSPTLYLGDDSMGLAFRAMSIRGARTLDLCAGPGLQALACAARGHQVVAVEINPVAAALCSVNAVINQLAEQVTVLCGDLYEPVAGERFDLVLANPPLLPIPRRLPFPFVGDGGPDGLTVVRRVLRGLPDHLAERGRAYLVGSALTDGFLLTNQDELATLGHELGLSLNVTTYSHASLAPGAPMLQALAQTVAATPATGEWEEIEQELAAEYRALGGSHLCTYLLRAERGDSGMHYVDLSDPAGEGLTWFL
jgi:HemK-related putative methylase